MPPWSYAKTIKSLLHKFILHSLYLGGWIELKCENLPFAGGKTVQFILLFPLYSLLFVILHADTPDTTEQERNFERIRVFSLVTWQLQSHFTSQQ